MCTSSADILQLLSKTQVIDFVTQLMIEPSYEQTIQTDNFITNQQGGCQLSTGQHLNKISLAEILVKR